MRYINVNCLTSANGNTKNGVTLDTNQWVSASFHAIFADSGAGGTFKLQASNDINTEGNPQVFVPTNWVDIPSQTASVSSGAAALLTVSSVPYRWVRAVWTKSAGTGAVTVNVMADSV